MAASGLPFDDIRDLIAAMPGPDMAAANAVRARDANLTKPAGSLGRLEEIAEWLAAWQGKAPPEVRRPLVCVFAGNHGVVAQGVSAYPQAVTRQMLENFAAGGAAINQICAAYDLGFKVFDLALDLPTGDFTQTDALDERACVATMAFGMEALVGGTDLLCYRASSPQSLAERQARTWQPWLDWAERQYDARLVPAAGVIPAEQDPVALRALRTAIERLDDWRLVGLHAAVTTTGSLVLGLAIERGALAAAAAFDAALLDELFEIEQWGEDAEQSARHARLRADLEAAERYLALLSAG